MRMISHDSPRRITLRIILPYEYAPSLKASISLISSLVGPDTSLTELLSQVMESSYCMKSLEVSVAQKVNCVRTLL